jgi:hypothetical protein
MAQSTLKGTIVETMNGAGYTYILLDQSGEKIWVATTEIPVKTGQEIELKPGLVMENFQSKSLNRVFEKIIFSAGLASGSASTHGHTTMGPASSQSPNEADPIAALSKGSWNKTQNHASSAKNAAPVKVEKAQGENAYTIAEIFAKADSLNLKPVRIRGKVVKSLPEIMGKNWIHLQDGTGSISEKNHDLVITSKDLPKVGQVVTMMGTLYTNKDFGSGYAYRVIVEEASVMGE